MIDAKTQIAQTAQQVHEQTGQRRKMLHMVKNDRMGGSVPSWDIPKTQQDKISDNLGNALYADSNPQDFNTIMALQAEGQYQSPQSEEFGFGDLFDMVNPLQHIPLVSNVYRSLTGDEIKPIGRIIGGSVYGGILGAASGLVNVIAEEETGEDLAGNAFNAVVHGQRPHFKSLGNDPESALGQAQELANKEESAYVQLPESLLAFAAREYDTPHANRFDQEKTIQRHFNNLPPREPITELPIDGSQKVAFREF